LDSVGLGPLAPAAHRDHRRHVQQVDGVPRPRQQPALHLAQRPGVGPDVLAARFLLAGRQRQHLDSHHVALRRPAAAVAALAPAPAPPASRAHAPTPLTSSVMPSSAGSPPLWSSSPSTCKPRRRASPAYIRASVPTASRPAPCDATSVSVTSASASSRPS